MLNPIKCQKVFLKFVEIEGIEKPRSDDCLVL